MQIFWCYFVHWFAQSSVIEGQQDNGEKINAKMFRQGGNQWSWTEKKITDMFKGNICSGKLKP